jgi:hypothetical protein
MECHVSSIAKLMEMGVVQGVRYISIITSVTNTNISINMFYITIADPPVDGTTAGI